ncbi:putative nuclease HARBI1 [Astyanax mexicanus]|nr:putative nuclease HARBI1 [Astyanax mexicanus]
MTPFREPVQNPVQARYNRHLSKARSVVERSFGMMKTRWRSIFFKALEVKFTFAPVVVSCCAFLHNLCLSNGDIVESAEGEPEEEPGEAEAEEHTSAAQPGDGLRDRLAAAVSAPGAAISALREHDY